jgi:hypothetical protein
MRSGRRARLIGFLGVLATVCVGSYAWACVQVGSHTGLTWICKATQTVTCNYNTITNNTNPTHSKNFYSQATGLSANATYDMRNAFGDHHHDTDTACENGSFFAGGQGIRTDSTGSWSGRGPLNMPSATGLYTVCAVPAQNPSSFLGSGNTLWTVT